MRISTSVAALCATGALAIGVMGGITMSAYAADHELNNALPEGFNSQITVENKKSDLNWSEIGDYGASAQQDDAPSAVEHHMDGGTLAIGSAEQPSLKVDRFIQTGGFTTITSADEDTARLVARDVVMGGGNLQVNSSAGSGIQGDLTLNDGHVTIMTMSDDAALNGSIGWDGSITQQGGMLDVMSAGGTAISGQNLTLTKGTLNIVTTGAADASGLSVGVKNHGRIEQNGGSAMIMADGVHARGLVLEGSSRYKISGIDASLNLFATDGGVALRGQNEVLPALMLDTSDQAERKDSAFTQNDGSVQITSNMKGTGIAFDRGGYKLSGGALNLDIDTGGQGIVVNGTNDGAGFYQENGRFTAQVSGNNSVGMRSSDVVLKDGSMRLKVADKGVGISIENTVPAIKPTRLQRGQDQGQGQLGFVQDGGSIEVDSEGQAIGIGLRDSGYKLSDGSLTINAKNGGQGVLIHDPNQRGGGFQLAGGTLSIEATGAQSVGLYSSNVVMNDGLLHLKGVDKGRALYIGDGSFTMRGGTLKLERDEATGTGWGIYGDNNSQAFFGGNSIVQAVVDINAQGRATGLMSVGHVIIEEGANVHFDFANTASLRSVNVLNVSFLESRTTPIDGDFILQNDSISGSSLFYDYQMVKSDDGQSYVVKLKPKGIDGGIPESGGNTGENSGSTPESDDNAGGNGGSTSEDGGNTGENSGSTPESGDNTGGNGGSTLEGGGNTGENSSGAPESGSNVGNMPENNVVADNHTLLRPSHLLSGANRNAARALERGLPGTADIAQYQNLNRAYDKLYNSVNRTELERLARGLHAYQATRFSTLIVREHDRMAMGMQRELARVADASVLPQLEQGRRVHTMNSSQVKNGLDWSAWVKPVGSVDNYNRNGASYGSLDARYGGVLVGTARRFGGYTIGLSGGYLYGDLDGAQGYNAKSNSFLVMAALHTDPVQISDSFKPTFDFGASYGATRFDQNRRDTLGGRNRSAVRADSVQVNGGMGLEYQLRDGLRFMPRAAIDYSYVSLDNYREHGGYLPLSLSANGYNSLQPRIGSELVWAIDPQLELNAYGYYRYEALDRRSSLGTRFMDMPDMHFKTVGENVSRSSGNVGVNMAYQLHDMMSVSGGYDLMVADEYDGHQFYVQGNSKF